MSNDDHNEYYTKLTTKVKRGDGPDDRDTTKIVTRHPDPGQAVANHDQALKESRRFASDARNVQPDESNGGDEDGDDAEE